MDGVTSFINVMISGLGGYIAYTEYINHRNLIHDKQIPIPAFRNNPGVGFGIGIYFIFVAPLNSILYDNSHRNNTKTSIY